MTHLRSCPITFKHFHIILIYVLVHNRGPLIANSVHVLAAITNVSTPPKLLPLGYTENIKAGTSLSGSDWTTVGTATLTDLRPGYPQVAVFDLSSNLLPQPSSLANQSDICLLVFIHSEDDPFTATEQNIDLLAIQERKVAQKNLHVVQFVGTPPAPPF
jgi:hypothetical protein